MSTLSVRPGVPTYGSPEPAENISIMWVGFGVGAVPVNFLHGHHLALGVAGIIALVHGNQTHVCLVVRSLGDVAVVDSEMMLVFPAAGRGG